VSFSGGEGQIPVQALLKLTLDQAGADTIQKFLDGHEQQWSRIEGSINRISSGVQEITRFGMGALGVAGIGALAQNFIGSSTAGSNVALAAGQTTGGSGAWHPYSQAMLGAQAKTGVPSTQIAQGLILALQSVGGAPSPAQAALLGGLLAGFGQVEGLTPAQVSQIVGPMLQAANKPLTAANLSSMLASTQATLTATPGSQSAPQLALISSIAQQQAIGGIAPQPVQTAALLNAAIKTNSLWRNTSVSGAAISGIQSGLQGAFQNPSQEAFMTMAGISYEDQRGGMTGSNVTKIMAAATKEYGTGATRDIALRSMFGLTGADLLEAYSPGSPASKILAAHPGATPKQINALVSAAKNPQARTTPESFLNKAAGKIFGLAESGPLGAGAVVAGGYGLSKLPGLTAKGLGELGGEDLLGILGGGTTMGLATLANALANPASAGDHGAGPLSAADVVLNQAIKRFHGNVKSKTAEQWMWNQFGHRNVGQGSKTPATLQYGEATDWGAHPGGATQAQQMLQKLFTAFASGRDPITTFQEATQTLQQAANALKGAAHGTTAHGASYQLGAGGATTQIIGSSVAGAEFASFTSGAAQSSYFTALTGGNGGGGANDVSLNLGGGGAATGAGWSACTLTWYDPALGGMNSSNGAANPSSATASGTPYSATANTCAAPPGYAFGTQIQFAYGGKTVTCTVNDRGGAITGSHFDLARAPATTLGIIGPGHVSAKFKVVSTAPASGSGSSSGGGSGSGGSGAGGGSSSGGSAGGGVVSYLASAAMMGAGAAPGGGQGGVTHTHIHVHIDGKEIRKARVLKGHKP
jgi:hypothetical protein